MSTPIAQLPSLPFDLIIHILSFLPPKSLFRFKSVSKSLSLLPHSPHFIRLHSLSHPHPPLLLLLLLENSPILVDRFGTISSFPLPLPLLNAKIRASTHGLLLCSTPHPRGTYIICNPSTNQFRKLPKTRERPPTRFHPEYEDTLAGIAVDENSWNFKVVLGGFRRVFGRRHGDQFVLQLFNSETNSWDRSVIAMDDEFTHMNRTQCVFSNGCLHWLTSSCSYVLVLDLRNGVNLNWGKIVLPDEVIAGRFGSRIYLLEMEGEVSVVAISGVWMSVWVLLDRGSERWGLVDRVHLRCIHVFAASVFPIAQNREMVLMATQKKILTYHRGSKLWREIYGVNGNVAYPLWFSAFGFRSTLFPCHSRG